MKTLLVFIAFTLLNFCLYGQFKNAGAALYPVAGSNGYEMTEDNFNNQLIHRVFTNKQSGKPALEFIRYDADNFICVEYDSMGKQTSKGIISPNKEKAPHYKIQMPDLANDPEMKKGLMKDSVLYDEYYDKNGYWEETAVDGSQWRGIYEHDVKQGIWEKLKSGFAEQAYTTDTFIVYKNGNTVSDLYKATTDRQLFEMLHGKWFGDRRNQSRSYQVFHRKPVIPFDKEPLVFSSPNALEIHTRQGIDKLSWLFANNQLTIGTGDRISKLDVVYIDPETLIVQRLQD